MTEARTALDATMSLLASAPAGKGGSADLEMMRQDLERASASLTEAEASFAGGNYQDAVVKAQGVMESVQTVHAAVQAALDAKTGTNPRG